MKVRTVILMGADSDEELAQRMARARRERAKFMAKLWRLKNAAAERERKRLWREANKKHMRAYRQRWSEENREHLRAYYRNYDATKPGRREYKANWQRAKEAALA